MSYSRRELYAAGEPLGESATRKKLGGGYVCGSGMTNDPSGCRWEQSGTGGFGLGGMKFVCPTPDDKDDRPVLKPPAPPPPVVVPPLEHPNWTYPTRFIIDPEISDYWTPDKKMEDYNKREYIVKPPDIGIGGAAAGAAGGGYVGYAAGGAIGGNFGDPSPAPFAGVPSAFSGVPAPTTSMSRSRSSGLSTPATGSSSMGQNNHREVDTYVAPTPMSGEQENGDSSAATTAPATTTSAPTFITGPTVDAAPSALLQPGNNRVVTAPPATETAGTPATQAELDDIEENNHPEWNQPKSNERPVPEGQRGAYNVGTEGAFGNKADVGYEGVDPNETYRTGTKPGEYKYYNYYANGPYQGMFFAEGGMPGEDGEEDEDENSHEYASQLQQALQSVTSQAQDQGGRYLKGPGDGMSDEIPAAIDGQTPAALSDGEFVISADVVSGLGNGSSDAGAKVLHQLMDRVRKARTGTTEQAKKIKPEKLLPKNA